jgi:hypothetical protein
MMLAVAAGLAITLYRNDVLSNAAKSAGSEGVYARVESAFGQPGFGTTRSVEQLAAMMAPAEAVNPLPAAPPAATGTPSEPTRQSDLPEKVSLDSAPEPTPAAAQGKPSQSTSQAPSHVKSKKLQRPSGKQKLKKFKGSEYDPMNASL